MTRSIMCFALLLASVSSATAETSLLFDLASPVIFQGDEATAYRDPTVVYHDGIFHLYCTVASLDPSDGGLITVTAHSQSSDLKTWTPPAPVAFTPRDRSLNYSSPGNVIRHGGKWIMCLQTYPTVGGQTTGSRDSRIWTMSSDDLVNWGDATLLRVKGPNVAQADMGRMIDPYLVEDKDEPGKWWCFYKQNGVSRSWSRDLVNWTYVGSNASIGENACILRDGDQYVMFASPGNGVKVYHSSDLAAKDWSHDRLLTLGQADWPWASGRLTAGFVLDLRDEPRVGKYVMFFHGSRKGFSPETHGMASLGIAWSDDLVTWDWPGKTVVAEPGAAPGLVSCCLVGLVTYRRYAPRQAKQ
ncbi:MAG: hypothetical protein JW809_04840 [Pirellulales bacterium]|nr:hypothetical protein [Pirellulales bacterium]